ncbi:MAG: FAD-dependent oxidoreductase [Liquorilactobacillus nagelii]|jgi:NADPH-dependent 2,4-dienoyl-CoA reductase/sulfur reductase-like enzyme/rhodanese-related sulfurtransferase|uniref:FAD-dependent oxidoreductase n=1 Tax=Liquorilactobacillus nagelii TaxID=82688 RepID=UPI002431D63B|nr:FAD-dependent oxidoreductase [Liquorilactobacillus nagelii]MCI1633872.1 FAD-dependent oxidoreductase [Liquorilactobacillus nagelii]
MRIIIVGGVAGGMSAAARLRRLDETIEIIILEKGNYVSFANCGLPYYLGGEITDKAQLVIKTPAELQRRFNLDIRLNHEVVGLDSAAQEITVKNAQETKKMHYDRLLLAPGAHPIIPKFSGVDLTHSQFTLRGIPDLEKIIVKLQQPAIKRIAVIGGGAIGLEITEALLKQKYQVALLEAQSQLLTSFDPEMSVLLAQELEKHGVKLHLNAKVAAIQPDNDLILADQTQVAADAIIFALGVRPDTACFTAAGLKSTNDGSLLVDENYQTSLQNVYAVGDAILTTNQLTGKLQPFRLASPANRQGRQAADAMLGYKRKNRGNIGTSIVRIFGLGAAQTGLNEKQLHQLKRPFNCLHLRGSSHVAYFPGAQPLSLKLLFEPDTGKIWGAQAVGNGGENAARRIDILATAIKAGMTVNDLPELELSYSPPFGAAKDPVNLAGYAAQNLLEGLSENIQWHELSKYQKAGAYLIDVREPQEITANGAYPQAHNIPVDQLRERLNELPADKLLITACQSGQRSYLAERILRNHGFRVKNLDGGWLTYQAGMQAVFPIADKL